MHIYMRYNLERVYIYIYDTGNPGNQTWNMKLLQLSEI